MLLLLPSVQIVMIVMTAAMITMNMTVRRMTMKKMLTKELTTKGVTMTLSPPQQRRVKIECHEAALPLSLSSSQLLPPAISIILLLVRMNTRLRR